MISAYSIRGMSKDDTQNWFLIRCNWECLCYLWVSFNVWSGNSPTICMYKLLFPSQKVLPSICSIQWPDDLLIDDCPNRNLNHLAPSPTNMLLNFLFIWSYIHHTWPNIKMIEYWKSPHLKILKSGFVIFKIY